MDYYNAPPDPEQNNPLEPHNLISGSLPGATEIRMGNNIIISGKDQRVTVNATAGSITVGATSDGRLAMEVTNADGTKTGIGQIPGSTALGFYTLDASGNVVQKIVGATSYIYDVVNNKNVAQMGKLPDGTYGTVFATPGHNVSEIYA